jgi:outer membrane lipoprotein SlyB
VSVSPQSKENSPLRKKLIASVSLALAALSVAAAPMVASAQPHRHRVQVCGAGNNAKNTGTVVGAVTGGLLGNAVSHGGGKTGGTIIGAGVGAVAGHQIAKSNGRTHCHYEWRRN